MRERMTGRGETLTQYRVSFEEKLSVFGPEEKSSLMRAFDEVCKCHPLSQKRDEGVPYLDHVVKAAVIAIEGGIRDVNDIIVELFHDAIEESNHIVKLGLPFAERIKRARAWLTQKFNPEVADGVIALTKPTRKDVEPKTKARAREVGIEMFKALPSKDKVRKMPDRVHNLRTLSYVSLRRQERTLDETRDIYLPEFREAVKDHPEYQKILETLEFELNEAQKRYDKEKEARERKPVASCILRDAEGKILLIHRNTPEAQQWDTPGGKIEPNEDAKETVKRETREELGVEVKIGKELIRYRVKEGEHRRNHILYLAEITGGGPIIREEAFDKLGYFSLDELWMMDQLSSNIVRLVGLYKKGKLRLSR